VPPVLLARLAEIPDGGLVCRAHGAEQVLLARRGDEIFALDDSCTHAGGSLHEGELDGADCVVTCPWHQARFDLRTGRASAETPWASDTRTFGVELRGDEVWVEL
jgi:nitrite reductase/ring-hydroxylating ferredoxin subunit